ncbi:MULTISPECIES: hypothetical protein [unclassified Streptomyces]|nr:MULTISPECIES: hypothetical protein [unclassified Streptomyces]MCZ7415069.1 hypothetical protein [Streptomyces sp. WMMC897]MCZ7432012.1 hypothetical protein [Streptomyces sp. WMMC1477]
MATLAAGSPISVNAGGVDAIYSLSARPIAVGFMADGKPGELVHAAV